MKQCEKIPFNTEEEAKEELMRIIITDFKPWVKKHIPNRLYLCQWCSKYHLTSKPTVTKY